MTDNTLFVGLDVHKKTIAVALIEASAGAEVRFYGTIPSTPDAIRGLYKKLSKDGQQLHICYEAGPCGYGVQRQSSMLGHRCDVVAPALIPRKVGDKVKTDRRDAMMLAQTLRAGQLTSVWVPDEAHEAMRDLVRLRSQAMRDLRKSRQHPLSFLLRHGLSFPHGHWTKAHRRWLGELTFAHPAQHLALEEMLHRIERAEALCDRLKTDIKTRGRLGAAARHTTLPLTTERMLSNLDKVIENTCIGSEPPGPPLLKPGSLTWR